MNPILRQELRARTRGRRGVIVLTASLLLLLGVYALAHKGLEELAARPWGARSEGRLGLWLFAWLAGSVGALVTLLTPSFACNGFTAEKEGKTMDLLAITLLSPLQIVIGKLFSSIHLVLLFTAASAPILFSCVLFGGVDPSSALGVFLLTPIVALAYGAIGLYFSLLFRRTLTSTVMSYLVVGFLHAIPPLAALLWFVILQEKSDRSFLPLFTWTWTTIPVVGILSFVVPEIRLQAGKTLGFPLWVASALFHGALAAGFTALLVTQFRRLALPERR